MSTVTVDIKGKEDVSTHAKKAGNSLHDLVQEQNNMVKAFSTAAIAGTAVIGAIRQIAQTVDECVISFAENERAAIAFNAAIAQSGTISAGAGNALAQFAEQIATMTGETGESVQSMETLLITSGRTEGEVRKLISAAVDMSAATGKDLRTSVEELNKTFSGTEGRMGQLIPELKDLTDEELKNGAAIDIIAAKYDGLGDALASSTDVSIKNYKNAMADLKAELGGVISIGLTPMREWLTDLVRQWGEATSAARSYAAVQQAIAAKDTGALILFSDADLKAALGKQQKIAQDMYAATVSGKSYDMGGGVDVKGPMLITAYNAQLKALQDIKLELSRRDSEQKIVVPAPLGGSPATGSSGGIAGDVALGVQTAFQGWNWESTIFPQVDQSAVDFYDSANSNAGAYAGWESASEREVVLSDEAITSMNQNMLDSMHPDSSSEGFSLFGGGQAAVVLESLGEMFQGTTGAAFSAAGASATAGGDPLQNLMAGLGPVISAFTGLLGSLGMFQALMDPIGTILAGVMDILGPIIDTLLTPLVGILRIVGQTIGKVLAPLLEMLGPIIGYIAEAFVWFYNKVMKPIGNGLIAVFNIVYNGMMAVINGIIWAINLLLPKNKEIGYASYRELTAGALTDIDVGQVSTAGTASSSTTTTGTNASYSQARDVTVNVSVTTSALVGDDGIRQFALMIWREIQSAGVLGAA